MTHDPPSGSESTLAFDQLVQALRAAGEPTRLRILGVLSRIELTVGEICMVLGQTQPRVSRHLKLLVDAGLLERHSEGTYAFYRLVSEPPDSLVGEMLLGLADSTDEIFRRDGERLDRVRADRAKLAAAYFEEVAQDWDEVRALHVADAEVESAMLAAVEGRRTEDLLDVGTGTGRVLELFAPRIRHGLGIDLCREMLNLARTQLDSRGLKHCSVRLGDVYDLDMPSGSVDIATMHHVLHYLDHPSAAILECARTLRPGGSLVIVDFAPHDREHFRADYAHRFLGFADGDVERWCRDAGLVDVETRHLTKKKPGTDDLTITLCVARQHRDSHGYYTLKSA